VVRSKTIDYGLRIINGSRYITVENMRFLGTTVFATRSEETDRPSRDITFQGLDFVYPSYNKRMIRSRDPPVVMKVGGYGMSAGVYLQTNSAKMWSCANSLCEQDERVQYCNEYACNGQACCSGQFSLLNNTFSYADGKAIEYTAVGGVIKNNRWSWFDFSNVNAWVAGGGIATFSDNGYATLLEGNTFEHMGCTVSYLATDYSQVIGNRLTDQKDIANDGAMVHYFPTDTVNTTVNRNWGYHSAKSCYRFDDGSVLGHNGTMSNNVCYQAPGMVLKGDYQLAENNLCFDKAEWNDDTGVLDIIPWNATNAVDSESRWMLVIPAMPAADADLQTIMNNNTRVERNVVPGIGDGFGATAVAATQGILTNNVQGDPRLQVRDADNLDLRLRCSSTAATLDAGPFRLNYTANFSIAGRQEYVSSFPIPPDGSTNVNTDADLMWLTGLCATTHRVFFSSERAQVEGRDCAALQGAACGVQNVAEPGALTPNGTYYWRVDSILPSGHVYSGSVWSFTVGTSDGDSACVTVPVLSSSILCAVDAAAAECVVPLANTTSSASANATACVQPTAAPTSPTPSPTTASPTAAPTAPPTPPPTPTATTPYSSGSSTQSPSPASPTATPATPSPTPATVSISQQVRFTAFDVAAYTGDLKTVYERGYGHSLGIFSTALNAYNQGCSVDSSASSARRDTAVSFQARIPSSRNASAISLATSMNSTTLASSINEAYSADPSFISATDLVLPSASSIGAIGTATSASVDSVPSSSSSDDDSKTAVYAAVGAGGGVLLLVLAALAYYFCCCNSSQQKTVDGDATGADLEVNASKLGPLGVDGASLEDKDDDLAGARL